MKLIFATHNQHKLQEIKLLLPKSIDLVSLADVNFKDDIAETANTLKDNALLKARCIYKKFNLNCFADDSGLEVEVLNGAPGVYSARYAGENKSAEENIEKLLGEMQEKSDRTALFKTVIAVIIEGKVKVFDGVIKGTIAEQKMGEKGFGYDPIFVPEGHKQSFAQMGMEEKNKISHRAIAVNKFNAYLRQII